MSATEMTLCVLCFQPSWDVPSVRSVTRIAIVPAIIFCAPGSRVSCTLKADSRTDSAVCMTGSLYS